MITIIRFREEEEEEVKSEESMEEKVLFEKATMEERVILGRRNSMFKGWEVKMNQQWLMSDHFIDNVL